MNELEKVAVGLGALFGHVGANAGNLAAMNNQDIRRFLMYKGIEHALAGKKLNSAAAGSFNALLGPELLGSYNVAHQHASNIANNLPEAATPERLKAIQSVIQDAANKYSKGQLIGDKSKNVPMYGDLLHAAEAHIMGRGVTDPTSGLSGKVHGKALKMLMGDDSFLESASDGTKTRLLKSLKGALPAAGAAGAMVGGGGLIGGIPGAIAGAADSGVHMGANLLRASAADSPVVAEFSKDMLMKGMDPNARMRSGRQIANEVAGNEGPSFLHRIYSAAMDPRRAKIRGGLGNRVIADAAENVGRFATKEPSFSGRLGAVEKKVRKGVVDLGVSPALLETHEVGKQLGEVGITPGLFNAVQQGSDRIKPIASKVNSVLSGYDKGQPLTGQALGEAAGAAGAFGSGVKDRLLQRMHGAHVPDNRPLLRASGEGNPLAGAAVLGAGGLGAYSLAQPGNPASPQQLCKNVGKQGINYYAHPCTRIIVGGSWKQTRRLRLKRLVTSSTKSL